MCDLVVPVMAAPAGPGSGCSASYCSGWSPWWGVWGSEVEGVIILDSNNNDTILSQQILNSEKGECKERKKGIKYDISAETAREAGEYLQFHSLNTESCLPD